MRFSVTRFRSTGGGAADTIRGQARPVDIRIRIGMISFAAVWAILLVGTVIAARDWL